ncbi:hypothetical protein FMA36_07310 [Komagataeibacter xylinus]|uniref:Uncharacterized protein n=1 Tax=Komagataeibacter xylinus TaxID=28448 RepID=A0A857FP87_KOMXY|nr:hypothetical protein FMA36_07310 [Komagataeibacter xylinus]
MHRPVCKSSLQSVRPNPSANCRKLLGNIFSKSSNERRLFKKRQHPKTFILFVSALAQNHLVYRDSNAAG